MVVGSVVINNLLCKVHIHTYSEKATKFCEIVPLLLTVCTVVKSTGKISQNFVAFSEYMNFNSPICNSAINENNCVDNGHDLVIPSSDGGSNRHTIDCGPKLANLRRYWRDYYVDSSRMATSSSSAEVRKLNDKI